MVVENHEGNFSEDNWATVVNNKVSTKLKSVPVHKTVLNEKGQSCTFLPSEKEKHEAIKVLKSDFKVTTSNPASSKKLSPKLKIHNLKEHKFENKKLKKAILEKNSDIKHCLESNKDSFLDVLFIAKNQNNISLYSYF